MRVAVFGLGYVGTVTAACLASGGHEVVGVDVDPGKVDTVNGGASPVVEPGLAPLVSEAVAAGRLRATTTAAPALERADVSLICVGTPSAPGGATDLAYVERALDDVRRALEVATPPPGGHHTVVIRSTVPPGTGEELVAPRFAGPLPDGWAVATAMCPEFLREGFGVSDFFEPPYIVVGSDDVAASGQLEELFGFVDAPCHRVSVATAEALKFACNAFHATKVSFANEVARVFRGHGVDTREVMSLFCRDTKLNISPRYLRPGFAFGGSCLPKDLRSMLHLARIDDVDAPLLSGVMQTNDLVLRAAVDRVLATEQRRVALLGLSFKSGTDDLRESPNVDLAERLIGKGFDVRIYDPLVNPARLVGANLRHVEERLPHLGRLLTDTPEEALDGADVAIVSDGGPEVVAATVAADPSLVIDLNGGLGPAVEGLAGYEGVLW
ncbi:nucleotide sugar dehydrogenase [Nocardioides sediminis]|uniref:nucleotide sugar dehydrogenase n=1 Tax=Nocardioides sediminis TaxID=433648 RepID=UPI000D300C67|nr:nucleotide sugar dehydrogenase [Nocardioides sediminis]